VKVVLVVGCLDPLHFGHLCHFRLAKKLGDSLVVAVTRDEFVNKGPGRPVFSIEQRIEMVAALSIVDGVLEADGSLDALQIIKPSVFALGREYEGRVDPADAAYCAEHGIEIAFTDGPVFSSTKLLNDLARRG
jgi:cytidyltransferase-like protein